MWQDLSELTHPLSMRSRSHVFCTFASSSQHNNNFTRQENRSGVCFISLTWCNHYAYMLRSHHMSGLIRSTHRTPCQLCLLNETHVGQWYYTCEVITTGSMFLVTHHSLHQRQQFKMRHQLCNNYFALNYNPRKRLCWSESSQGSEC